MTTLGTQLPCIDWHLPDDVTEEPLFFSSPIRGASSTVMQEIAQGYVEILLLPYSLEDDSLLTL
jgi:hypothetical protein